MELTKKHFEDGLKCPSCNYETFVSFSLDGKDFYCGNCIADIISEHYIVAEREFNPLDYPDTFFPNWFDREHFETIFRKKLSDEEFNEIKEELENSNFADEVSGLFYEFLLEIKTKKTRRLRK